MIDALDLEPGARVADLGAGSGYFTFRLAEAVGPEGRVYAVDVDPEALASLRERAREGGHANVVAVDAEAGDARLPDGAIDLVFMCNAYHHLDDRAPYFARLRADLAPGGRLAIVEPSDLWILRVTGHEGHATPPEQVHDELAAAGYRPIGEHDFLPLQHLLLFAAEP